MHEVVAAVQFHRAVADTDMGEDGGIAPDHQLVATAGLIMGDGGDGDGGAVVVAILPWQAACSRRRRGRTADAAAWQAEAATEVAEIECGIAQLIASQGEGASQACGGYGETGQSDDCEFGAHQSLLFKRLR